MIIHRRGHNKQSVGARCFIKEEYECDKINKSINKYLDKLGLKHLDVSPGAMDSNSDLKYGVNKCNENNGEIFFSIHMNSSTNETTEPLGCEVWVYNDKNMVEAKRVCEKLSSLGFKNRGVKVNPKFYELKHTKCKAMIIEVCFVNSRSDVITYNAVGADLIAKAIVEGITGYNIKSNVNTGVYQVITESFSNKEYAIQYQEKLKEKGIKSFIQWREL